MTAVNERILYKESSMREFFAENLDLIEVNLRLIGKEFPLISDHGADGYIDILAEDAFGHFVIVELKKSNSTARAALHELSKYISLLKTQEGLSRDEIRCILVSSEWHELLEPFSYFRAVADVQVDGLHAHVNDKGTLCCTAVSPRPVTNLPTFSPEFDLFVYTNISERESHWNLIRSRAELLPYVRISMCLLDSIEKEGTSLYRSIVCIWRINDEYYSQIEEICGFSIGHLEPYAFPGWEPECDVLYWVSSEDTTLGFPGSMESQRGTAEKVKNLLARYEPAEVLHCNRGTRTTTLNNVHRVISLLCGLSPRLPLERQNPAFFKETISRVNEKSWETTVKGFLHFVEHVPVWQEIARKFLGHIRETMDHVQTVELRSFRKKHFFYAIHQASVHPNATLSNLEIILRDGDGKVVGGMVGMWSWDGTCPSDALEAIQQVYGSPEWAIIALFSAVDHSHYQEAYELHGFYPTVVFLEAQIDGKLVIVDIQPSIAKGWSGPQDNPLQQLVNTHADYAAQVTSIFKDIPTEPGEGVQVIGIK